MRICFVSRRYWPAVSGMSVYAENLLRELVGLGAKIQRFPQEVLQAGFKEAMALYDELSAKNSNWKKIYDDYSKFRADQNLWFSVAESSLDQFTQAQRR